VEGVAAGGGAREVCVDGEWRWQGGTDGEAAVPEEEEGRRESEGLVCNSQKFQGLLCKLKIPNDTKS
jgi:hypothetical protein